MFSLQGSGWWKSFCKDPIVLHQNPKLNLNVEFENPNDGTSIQNNATINNLF